MLAIMTSMPRMTMVVVTTVASVARTITLATTIQLPWSMMAVVTIPALAAPIH